MCETGHLVLKMLFLKYYKNLSTITAPPLYRKQIPCECSQCLYLLHVWCLKLPHYLMMQRVT